MNILIIGLGSIGKKHLAAIRKISPNSKIYALRSSLNAQTESGVINIFNISDLQNIDFAIISNPTSLHKETIEKLLFLNCPLFIEKPLFHTLEIIDLVQEIEQRGILNYIACNLRFLECLLFVKSKINKHSLRINEINVYCGSYLPEWRQDKNFRDKYSAHPELGGGVHLDLIHELDYIYWFFGKPLNVRKTFSKKSSLNIDSYDYANYCLEYDNFCVSIILNYFRKDLKRKLELVLENDTWEVDIIKNTVSCGNQLLFNSQQKIADTYELQMNYFINLVYNKTPYSENTVRDALNVLQICLE